MAEIGNEKHMTQMRELQQSWMAGKTPEERHKLMLEHRQAMGGSMQMMGGCPMHGGMQMGMVEAGLGGIAQQAVDEVDGGLGRQVLGDVLGAVAPHQ